MDENLEHKIRDLKLKIQRVEKELAKTLHNANLGAWLHAGHPSQMAKAGERERKRLEAKITELREKLEELAPGSMPQPVKAEAVPEPAPAPEKAQPVVEPPAPVKAKTAKPKPAAVKTTKAKPAAKSSKTSAAGKGKTTGKTVKKAAVKKPAASKSAKPKKKKYRLCAVVSQLLLKFRFGKNTDHRFH